MRRTLLLSLLLFATCFRSSDAIAFTVHELGAGQVSPDEAIEPCTLRSTTITYWIDRTTLPSYLTLNEVRRVVTQAAAGWENVKGLYSPVKFVEAAAAPAPLLDNTDNVVVITWDNTSSVVPLDSKALAITNKVCFPPDIWSPGADIYLRNTNSPIRSVYTPITWVTSKGLKDLRVPGAVYLPGVLAHEFGHILGLGESQERNATMYFQDTSLTFRRWYQLLLGQVSLVKDDEDGLRYLYSRAPVSGAPYLTFNQGNPGTPGDGIFITFQGGSDPWALVDFELSTPFPLASAPNGFTLTAFFETLPVTSSNRFNVIFGIPGRRECNATVANPAVEILGPIVNGVQGIAIVYSRQELERIVTLISSGTGCTEVTVDDFVLSGFFVFDLSQPDTFAKDLDAAALGVGQHVFPTSGTPAP